MASAPPNKTRRRRKIPRSTYKAGDPGGTTFDFAMEDKDTHTVDLQDYEVEHHIDRKLKDFKAPSSEMTQNQLDRICPYIIFQSTPSSKGHRFITKLKWSYSRHVLKKPEHLSKVPADNADYRKYLRMDPLGNNEPGVEDPRCWKTHRGDSGDAHVPTTFLNNIRIFQDQTYLHLRASIGLYIDERCTDHLKNWVRTQEKEKRIAKNDSLTKGKRLTWKQFSHYILNNLCAVTKGSFFYLKVHTILRQDNETFHTWCNTIAKIVNAVKRHKKGWEAVVDVEALTVLIDWLQQGELRVLEMHLFRKNLHNKHLSVELMPHDVSVTKFIEIFADVKPAKLPGKFTQAKQKDALAKTLVAYPKYQKALALIKEKDSEIAKLKAELHAAKQNGGRRRPARETPKPTPTPKPKGDPNMKDGVRIGKYGKAKDNCCQHCQNLGMKNRKHPSAKCDPVLRKERHQAKLKKEAAKRDRQKGKTPPKQPKPTFRLQDYGPDACEHCIRENADPKFANRHPGKTCYRRPGGELDKLGIKDATLRTKKIKELIRQRYQDKADKNAALKQTNLSVKVTDRRTPNDRLPHELRIYDKDADQNDPRLTKYDKHLGFRYLRNEIAVKKPLTIAEIDKMLPFEIDRIDMRTRAKKRFKYECLDGLFRLREHRAKSKKEQEEKERKQRESQQAKQNPPN